MTIRTAVKALLVSGLLLGINQGARAQDEQPAPGETKPAPKKKAKAKKEKEKEKLKEKKEEEERAKDPGPEEGAEASSHHGTSVTFSGISAHLGAEYRLDLERDDLGFEKSSVKTPRPNTGVTLAAMKLRLSGEAAKDVDYEIVLDPQISQDPVEVARATWWMTKSLGISAGKDRVNEGGFEQRNWSYETVELSPYLYQWLPLALSEPMLEVSVEAAGRITLQVADDTRPAGVGQAEQVELPSSTTQPAFTLAWVGAFGPISPLVEYGVYDGGPSFYADLGLQFANKEISLSLDYMFDSRSTNYPTGSGTTKAESSNYNNIVVMGELRGKTVEPFFKLAFFNVQEPNDDSINQKDRSFNTTNPDYSVTIDDNENLYAIGARFPVHGEAFMPYVDLTMATATFEKTPGTGTLDDRTELSVHLGVAGSL